MKWLQGVANRWKKKQTPSSETKTLDRDLLRQDIGLGVAIFAVGVVLCLLVVRCTRTAQPTTPTKTEQSSDSLGQEKQEAQAHMIYFGGSGRGDLSRGRTASRALGRGTLVRVRLLNSLQTFETVPAFAQVVDYTLGRNRYGATLIGDASGDGAVERIKITFNALKLQQTRPSIPLEGLALSLDGTLGLRAEKLEGFMGRAVTSGAQSGASGLSNFGGSKGDLNQFLMKALLSGLQNELSSDLSAAHNRASALSLEPGTEFYVQLVSDFFEVSQ